MIIPFQGEIAPFGAGIACTIEGGISEEHTRQETGAAWTYNYTPYGYIKMLRARDYGTQAWADVRNAIEEYQPILPVFLSEPENENEEGDGFPAEDAARIFDEWSEQTRLAWPRNRKQFEPYEFAYTPWVGFGCLLNLESGFRWEKAYQAAGGREPPIHAGHYYCFSPADVEMGFSLYDGHLSGMGWHNPLIFSEIGIMPDSEHWKSTPKIRASILRAVFKMLRDRPRCAGFAWFSNRYPAESGRWAQNDLFLANGQLSALGEVYAQESGKTQITTTTDIYLPIAARMERKGMQDA